ncbi:capsid assembly scaffolding protein Gp46 family protein [Enterococcus faecalis]|uniref:capsid assembly scaffolding protein Gp46 family protein n=1 Tax=Enterococcus faecalis TaxID=1351 RepID=UPI004042322A
MKTTKLLPMNLQMFADGGETEPEFTIDDFKTFIESNEDAQKFIQSQSQNAAAEQLEAWKQKNLDKLKQEAVQQYEEAKKNKTPEQLELEKLKAEFEAEKAKSRSNENKAFVAEQIADLELDKELKDSISQFMLNTLVSDNTEFTQKAVESFTGVLSTINEKHAEAIKNMEMTNAFGNKQQQTDTGNQSKQTIENPKEALGQKLQAFN